MMLVDIKLDKSDYMTNESPRLNELLAIVKKMK